MPEQTPRPKRPKRPVEDADFLAMLQRQLRALEVRALNNPEVLAAVVDVLQPRLAEIPNAVIAQCSARYADDPRSAPSAGEIARLLGISAPAASQRAARGERILFERSMGEGSIPQRERAARTKAQRRAADQLAGWLARRDEVDA